MICIKGLTGEPIGLMSQKINNQTLLSSDSYALAKGRTTVTIDHRLSTMQNSDRIIVIGKEGIIEQGNHMELMKKKGVYGNLYNAQSHGFIPDMV